MSKPLKDIQIVRQAIPGTDTSKVIILDPKEGEALGFTKAYPNSEPIKFKYHNLEFISQQDGLILVVFESLRTFVNQPEPTAVEEKHYLEEIIEENEKTM